MYGVSTMKSPGINNVWYFKNKMTKKNWKQKKSRILEGEEKRGREKG
jgi:hypothetical protein